MSAFGNFPPVVTQMLVSGITNILTQNVIYALPARNVWLQTSVVIQTSLDGSNFTDVAASTTGVHVVAPFIKNTNSSTGAIAIIKILS